MRSRWSSILLSTLCAVGLGVVSPSDSSRAAAQTSPATADQAPIVANDSVTITPITSETDVHVLANDNDPDGGDLQICRIEAPDDTGLGVHIWSDPAPIEGAPIPSQATFLVLEPRKRLPVGTLSVTYYACDRELLTPATLSVNVVRVDAAAVPGRSGFIRFNNPLDYPIAIVYAAPHAHRADGALTLAPHATKVRKVRHGTIRWFAFPSDAGDDPLPIDLGTVRHTGARSSRVARGALTPSQRHLWRARSARPLLPRHSTPDVALAVRSSTSPTDPAIDPAPTTANDQITLDYYDQANVHVLVNDSDDTPDELAVCWVDVPADSELSALVEPWWADSDRARSDSPDRYLDLDAESAGPGTYALTYYACDRERMTPGVLEVTVRAFPRPKVERVPGDPGTLEVVNRGYRAVTIQYFQTGHYSEKYRLRVPPHGRRKLHVSYDDLTYFAGTKIGPLGSGRVRHLHPGSARDGVCRTAARSRGVRTAADPDALKLCDVAWFTRRSAMAC